MNRSTIVYFTIGVFALLSYMNRVKLLDQAVKLSGKWTGLHPEVKKRALLVLDAAETAFEETGYSVHIFDGKREISKQNEYIKKGTSFISNPLNSYHVWGLAVDFVFKDADGNWTWEPGADCAFYDFTCHSSDWYWDTLGEIIESAGFEWGGRWKSFDGPHAQLTTFGTTRDFIAKYGNPDNASFV